MLGRRHSTFFFFSTHHEVDLCIAMFVIERANTNTHNSLAEGYELGATNRHHHRQLYISKQHNEQINDSRIFALRIIFMIHTNIQITQWPHTERWAESNNEKNINNLCE